MKYLESITFLYGLQKFGMKFGLRGIQTLLHALGNPHRHVPAIHIAGTNGKGSTAAMIAAIYTAAGYKTGLYTSPHLINFNERIRINGRPISDAAVAELTSRIKPIVASKGSTFFEVVTAIAFKYFADENVDIAVIETGLGGRLDATNVLEPLVSVITTIGLEHTHILGKTYSAIAREKGGIIKKNTPCVIGVMPLQARQVLEGIASEKHAKIFYSSALTVIPQKATMAGSTVKAISKKKEWDNLHIDLPGQFQLVNFSTALQAVLVSAKRGKYSITERAMRNGLSHIRRLTGIHARCMVVRERPLTIVDVAHNPDAIKMLVQSLQELGIAEVRLVFGAMKDKDVRSMAKTLASIAAEVTVVSAKTKRSCPVSEIEKMFKKFNLKTYHMPSVAAAVHNVRVKRDLPILITGSHFVVGEALAFLEGKKYLTINQ